MHRTTALGLEALQKVLWWTCTLSAGNLGLFVPLQHSGHRDPAESFSRRHHRLWISYLSFFYPSKSISDSRKENGFVLATLYFTIPGLFPSPIDRFSRVSIPRSRSPLQFLQTRDSSKENSGQGHESGALICLYSPQGEVTPTTSSALEPSLSDPERMLGDDAGERETA
ncbi:hypothetical protein BKA70DRAFT_1282326 [Coprinopsis sp. MPI-PUGE-AT-0042]|nr:hypothetical protein BKA70DRAFT_1282326 [Coprinopsis sp. MPI-PUGE-AT-0042]